MTLRTRTQVARRLRRDATEVEKRLWWKLREAFPQYRFRRQHPVGRHIVDFACPSRKLAIELDGGQHALQQSADARRTEELRQHGYSVVRFWNIDVVENLEGVLETIRRELERKPAVISLSALQGGEGGRREAEAG